MPEAEIKKRGGALRFRTIKPKGKKSKTYFHVAVVPKPGPRGGHTVVGPKHHVGEELSLDSYLNYLFEKESAATSFRKAAEKMNKNVNKIDNQVKLTTAALKDRLRANNEAEEEE